MPAISQPVPVSESAAAPARAPACYRPVLWLVLATILCLAPFANKAVHIDDYLFIRSARQILAHPGDPFGISVNWYGTEMPLAQVTQNPPGACYYLAGAAKLFGWREVALHLAFLLPALAAVLGTYALARRFCPQPALATVIALVSPVFWVSATTLMSDVPMLALWVWALECWLRGLDSARWPWLAGAVALLSLAALTKYFGAALLPLLLVYTLVRERRAGLRLLWLLLPLLVLFAYDRLTAHRYGQGLLSAAGEYARTCPRTSPPGWRSLMALSFAGGGLLPVLCFAPRLWSRCAVALAALVASAAIFVLIRFLPASLAPDQVSPVTRWLVAGQLALFISGGLGILHLAIADFASRRTNDALLLLLWVGGTLVFTGAINWTVNGRSVLPLAPVVAILLVRRLSARERDAAAPAWWRRLWPLLPATALAATVVLADTHFAGQARTAARILHEHLGNRGVTIWFEGHWGFQYYMEATGARPIDLRSPEFTTGDYLVIPQGNTNITQTLPDLFGPAGNIEITSFPVFSTMRQTAGSGFYMDEWGPLPFACGLPHTHQYYIVKVRPPFL